MSRTTRVIVERNVRVPMRDGVELATDVYRPDDDGPPPGPPRAHARTTAHYVPIAGLDWIALAARPATSSSRRTAAADSGPSGRFTPFVDEATRRRRRDRLVRRAAVVERRGRDDRRLLRRRDAVAGRRRPRRPALKAIAPYVTASDYHEGWVYQGGAFQLGFSPALEPGVAGAADAGRPGARPASTVDGDIAEVRAAIDDIGRLYRHRPLRGIDLIDRFAPWYDEWLAHPSRDAFWEAISPAGALRRRPTSRR